MINNLFYYAITSPKYFSYTTFKDYKNRVQVTLVPNITNICYGRGVGYKIEKVVLSEKVQKISATKIRKEMRKKGKLK